MPPDRHGPAARPCGRERPRGRRGTRHDPGDGPADFAEAVLEAAARLLAYPDLGVDIDEGRRLAEQSVADGDGLERYERWVRAQGGDPDPALLERAPVRRPVPAPRDGVVTRLAALDVANAALELGAGRRTKADGSTTRSASSASRSAETRCWRRTISRRCMRRDDASAARAVEAVLAACKIGDEAPAEHGILLDVVA